MTVKAGEPVISAAGLNKSFDDADVVRDVTLDIAEGASSG
jgi:hypothetical protein